MLDDALLIEDQHSRERALALASFIVEAPAGAGKTELLTQRFLKLMQTVNEPEEIIAITFTNKAAAEMRVRILDSLLQAAQGREPAEPHKLITYRLSQTVLARSAALDWCLLDNPARLRIFTIDGLCAYLARQMPLMSRFGAQPAIAEDPEQHYAAAVDQTLALIDEAPYQDVVIDALRYFDNDTYRLKKLLIKMLSQRDQWLKHAQQSISPESLQSVLSWVVTDELTAISKVINAPIQHALMPLARHAAKHLSCEHSVALLNDWHDYLPTHANSLVMYQAVADLLLTGSDTLRKKVTVKDGFPPTAKVEKQAFEDLLMQLRDNPSIEVALQRIRTLPNINDHEAGWEIIATLSTLLNIAAAQLWLVFSQVREVDFVEVSQKAIDALMGEHAAPTDLALRLDYQIQHILVDEFQDTSPSQIELLEQLTQGWEAGDGRTLFLVGDPMQSIYRFRKANVGLFLNAKTDGIGNVKLTSLHLYRNNRSCPAVVDWINTSFNSIFPAENNTAQGAIAYRPFIATKKSNQAAEGVEVHPIVKAADESSDSAKQREAQAVVDIILKERQQNPAVKIAILVRAKSHLQAIVSMLRRHHAEIRFQAVEIEALHERQIIQDLLSLTRALYHRADRVSWLAVLRAPWCGLTLNDLHALAAHDHYATIWTLMHREDLNLSASGMQRLQHVRAIFTEAFAHKGRMNISRWVRSVWLMLGGASCLWAASDVIDVQAFFECVENLDRNNQFTLARIEAEIAKLYAAPDVEGEALQMMTIHKSKGLQFDVVILPGIGNGSNGGNDDQPIVLWEEVSVANELPQQQSVALLAAPYVPKAAKTNTASPYDYLSALETTRDRNESARILYVAVTRTERKLHLIGVANQNMKDELSPRKHSYLALLWPYVAHRYQTHNSERLDATEAQLSAAQFVPKLLRLKQPQIPTLLAVNSDQQYQRLQKQNQREGNPSAQDESSIAAAVGKLTHLYLELMAKKGLETWDEAKLQSVSFAMQSWFEQAGFSGIAVTEAVLEVQMLLMKTLKSQVGRWLLAPHTQSAAELVVNQWHEGDAKQSIVDRTFIETIAGIPTRWIIDYKTTESVADDSDAQLQVKAEQYRDQLMRYESLFVDEGLPIKKAIYFVRYGKLMVLA